MKIKNIYLFISWFVALLLTAGNAVADAVLVEAVDDALYAEECSACHVAYPPALLPERSWRKLLSELDKHFGEDASLNETDRQKLLEYAVSHSAENSRSPLAKKILRSIPGKDTPLRVVDVPYIKREHREIPRRVLQDNPEVKSLSNCDTCHRNSKAGSFAEREILIPGYGRWKD